jgi:hypothetical protein
MITIDNFNSLNEKEKDPYIPMYGIDGKVISYIKIMSWEYMNNNPYKEIIIPPYNNPPA